MSDLALSVMFFTVNPKYSNNSFAGADNPNSSIPITSPSDPTYCHQKFVMPASIANRDFTDFGSTADL